MTAVSSQAPRAARFPSLAKYEVLEELGHGGMATVYRAHDKRLGRDVAVKVIHPHLRDSGEIARRFSIEAQAVAKLRHPNIVEVYDVSAEGEDEQYLVVELLQGCTLRKILQLHGALPPEVAGAIGVELLGALAHAHSHGVVHRDIKPENVMIEHRPPPVHPPSPIECGAPQPSPAEQPGDRVVVKLTDFGIAKLLDAQGMTSTGQVLGSPAHMAPEQIEGEDVDARADIFGLGVLLYECMVGHLPFEGNNPAQVLRRVLDGDYPSAERERPPVGKSWSQILDKALARTPDERYSDANEMRQVLLTELRRLDVVSPRAELEAYCDAPDPFTEQHGKRMIALLCARALAARKRGHAMVAAADYNRALAYSPHDPALLRIVSSLHGADVRRRLFSRVAPLAAGGVVLGALAFGASRELRSTSVDPRRIVQKEPVAPTPPPASPPPTTGATPETAVPTARANRSPAPALQNAKPPSPKVVSREIKFSEVFPVKIVRVAVDGREARTQLSKDETLTIDPKAHVLTFSCQDDYCEPSRVPIESGDLSPAPLSVHLSLKKATLIVNGNSNNHYALADDPSVKLPVGQNVISMDTPFRLVSVLELESGARQSAKLVAGKAQEVSFSASPTP
jgi:serine/threonine-protein kinase